MAGIFVHVFLLSVVLLSSSLVSQAGPATAIITFGDSIVDVGNNDYILTIFKANYPPYGRDFENEKATGRFCNGRLATDVLAMNLDFTIAPAYLSPQAKGKNIINGTNFASAGAGYDEHTSLQSNVIPMSQQLEYYKEYQRKLARVSGKRRAQRILTDALYLVSAGSSDFIQNYYINIMLNKAYTPDQYSSYLVSIFTDYIRTLYGLGARKIGVTSLPPLGCLPVARTLFGLNKKGCVSRINKDAQQFNRKINAAASQLMDQTSGLKLVVFDIYQPLYELITNNSILTRHGFTEAAKGCCGTGTIETTSLLCNPVSLGGTCKNASQYVFWDSVHPSEATNLYLLPYLEIQGSTLIN